MCFTHTYINSGNIAAAANYWVTFTFPIAFTTFVTAHSLNNNSSFTTAISDLQLTYASFIYCNKNKSNTASSNFQTHFAIGY